MFPSESTTIIWEAWTNLYGRGVTRTAPLGRQKASGSSLPLFALLMLAQTSSPPTQKAAPPSNYTFKVTASQVWTDTGRPSEVYIELHAKLEEYLPLNEVIAWQEELRK